MKQAVFKFENLYADNKPTVTAQAYKKKKNW